MNDELDPEDRTAAMIAAAQEDAEAARAARPAFEPPNVHGHLDHAPDWSGWSQMTDPVTHVFTSGWSRTCAACGLVDARSGTGDMAPGELAQLPRRTYDWPLIKKTYVEGVKHREGEGHDWPTLDEVAAIHGVTGNRVREKSAQEGWRQERASWQAELETRRRSARAAALSKEAVNLDSNALTSAKMGLQLCQAALSDIAQRAQAARTAAGPGGGSAGAIDALEQQRLAAAVDLWHKVGLRAIGDPETHRIELTGPNGSPIEISQELRRDDPNRLAGVLAVLQAAGLGDVFGGPADAARTLASRRGDDGVHEALAPGS